MNRHVRFTFLVFLSIVAMSAVASVPYGKMSSLVRKAVVDDKAALKSKAALSGQTMIAFVCADERTGDSLLTSFGCKVYDRQGDIYVASLPVRRITAIASYSEVRRIEASAGCRLTMDTTATVINALPVYEGTGLPQAYTGRGVVVGVMDVGFDLTHPNFIDPSTGECRIRSFWDQLTADTIGSTMAVGRDYVTPFEIAEKQHSTDGLIQTHGTHTLGCAAGGGYDSPYRGIAFESDICAVSNAVTSSAAVIDSADLYKYTSAVDALGFKYIFDYASSVGSPCVASFSEGYTVGNDSEDSLFCAYLARLVGPGRIIVASAGNESVTSGYMHKPTDVERAGAFVRSSEPNAVFYVEGDGHFLVRLLAYTENGTDTLTISTDSCLLDTISVFPFKYSSDGAKLNVSVYSYPSSFTSGDTVYCFTLTGEGSIGLSVPIAVVLEGAKADVDLRCTSSTWLENGTASEEWNSAETTHNVNAPGCFGSVVTVGSTIHRTGFTNYKGTFYDYSQSGRNDGVRSYYSSVGPGVGNIVKPDVMAPGDNVVSSYSSFYLEHNPAANDINSDIFHFDYGGRTYAWNSNTGTSMAAPVVAGAVALWLQANPSLTPDDVKSVIARTSRHPEQELDYPNNYYGYGEIDVYRGLLCVLGIDGVEGLSAEPLRHVSVALQAEGNVALHFTTAPSAEFNVSIYSLSGVRVVAKRLFPDGGTTFVLPTSSLPSGIYAVQVNSVEKGCSGSTLVRKK